MKKGIISMAILALTVALSAQKKPEIEWISIPGGTFVMGTPTTEPERGSDERQHTVTLSPYKLSKYEVTFEQYDAFCRATKRSKPDDEGWGRGKRPVINVTWADAKAFADWMGCRLPTEAEWEFACRAGTTTPFNTGENLKTSQANYNGNFPYNGNTKGKYLRKSVPAGSYEPNAWGLCDMHGNVYEWCSDWYGQYPPVDETDPQGPKSGKYKVYRGGGWNFLARISRSGYRDYFFPERSDLHIGFRVASSEK
jgi:formylglycine-generating enzyme